MMKKVTLPPKPQQQPQPQKASTPPVASGALKATEIKITLEDGTYLLAKGDQAADVYSYLMDCERYCALRPGTVCTYLGPTVERFDANGYKISM